MCIRDRYEGGVIAPGVNLSIKNLSQATALLPLINLKTHQKNYGKNTIEALNAGFVWGYEGLINNIIDKIISRSKIKYKILLTGGYANFFNKMIKKKVVIDQDITIKGIANAIGAKKLKNCLIIDFGTATTFDVIKNGIYEGGVIAPGVNLSIKNLSQATALLPLILSLIHI